MNQSDPSLRRLALIIEGYQAPTWVVRAIESCIKTGETQIVLIISLVRKPSFEKWRHVCFFFYRWLDQRVFYLQSDALHPAEVQSIAPKAVWIEASISTPRGMRGDIRLNFSAETKLKDLLIDIVLDPCGLIEPKTFEPYASCGVYTLEWGRAGMGSQDSATFRAVIKNEPVITTTLSSHLASSLDPIVLFQSQAPVDRRSMARSQNHVDWKLSAALARSINKATHAHHELISSSPEVDAETLPSNWETLQGMTRLSLRFVKDRWRDLRYREQWILAYQWDTPDPRADRLQAVLPPEDRFWADPFPWKWEGNYYLFFEEFRRATKRGEILVLPISKTGPAGKPWPALVKDYHLSYPFLFTWENELFMMPESAEQRRIDVFRCRSFPDYWVFEKTLLKNISAVDCTLLFRSNKWWLFANVPPPGAGNWDELHVFVADTPFADWKPIATNPVKSDVRSARPAGNFFEKDGVLYRPSQDCSQGYGSALTVSRVTQLTETGFAEATERGILPASLYPGAAGIHTLNTTGDLTVFDLLRWNPKY